MKAWRWDDFLDALQWVAELRYGKPVRTRVHEQNDKHRRFRAALE